MWHLNPLQLRRLLRVHRSRQRPSLSLRNQAFRLLMLRSLVAEERLLSRSSQSLSLEATTITMMSRSRCRRKLSSTIPSLLPIRQQAPQVEGLLKTLRAAPVPILSQLLGRLLVAPPRSPFLLESLKLSTGTSEV